MDKVPPPPRDSVPTPRTGAPYKRPRSDSWSSSSVGSTAESLRARFITRTLANSKNADASRPSRSVRTLTSDDLEYVHENGRTYGNETYFLPCVYKPNNDFVEQDRLSLQHQIFVQALQGRLTTTKLLPSTRRILDLGTGPGQWAVNMANQYPHAEVVGIDMVEWDIDTTEATLGDSRVTWELDDLDVWGRETDVDDLVGRLASMDFITELTHRNPITSPKKSTSTTEATQSAPDEPLTIDFSTLTPQPEPGWHFSDSFELIHMRSMKGIFTHWEEVYAEIYKSLSPGGWIEVADWDLGSVPLGPEHAKDPANLPMPTLRKLYAGIMQASFRSGRPLGLYYMNPSYLEEAGFEDIQTTHVNVPVGQWSEDEAQKSIGKMMFVLGMETFEPLCLRLLTQWGSKERVWTAEEVRADCERAQEEVQDWVERSERGEVEGWCASFKWITARKSWHAER